MRRAWIVGVAVALLGLPVPAEATATSFDYTRIRGLSRPQYPDVLFETFDVPMRDGVELHVQVNRPDARGRFGTILRISPYHNKIDGGEDAEGTNVMPRAIGSLVDYFAPRGYAVVFADLRGTGLSQGCLDYLGPTDVRDMHDIIEWIAARDWSNGRVGMIGASYPGSTPIAAAGAKPPHLTTIVPIAGLSGMYDHQFQNGVPYYLQWAGPMYVYETFSTDRFVQRPERMGGGSAPACGLPNSASTNGEPLVSGAQTPWHRARDHASAAQRNRIPVFLVHGTTDAAVRTAATHWFHGRRNPADKVWIGQWAHAAPPRGEQWVTALHAWFDRHLQRRNVTTGPPVELFTNDGRVLAGSSWPLRARGLDLFAAPGGGLGVPVAEEAVETYVADPAGRADEFRTGHLAYTTAPFRRETMLAGVPTLRLKVAVTSPRVHLLGNLYDVAPDDTRVRIGRAAFALQPEFRDGVDRPRVVTPGEVMTLTMTGMLVNHLVRAGHRVELRLTSSHVDKVPAFAAGAAVQVSVGGFEATRLTLPVVDRPALRKDIHQPG